MPKVNVSTESKDPLLSINKQTKTTQNPSTKLTGSFNALIPNIQQIAKKYQQLASQAQVPSSVKKKK